MFGGARLMTSPRQRHRLAGWPIMPSKRRLYACELRQGLAVVIAHGQGRLVVGPFGSCRTCRGSRPPARSCPRPRPAFAAPSVMLHGRGPGELNCQASGERHRGADGCENALELAPNSHPRRDAVGVAGASPKRRQQYDRTRECERRCFMCLLLLQLGTSSLGWTNSAGLPWCPRASGAVTVWSWCRSDRIRVRAAFEIAEALSASSAEGVNDSGTGSRN